MPVRLFRDEDVPIVTRLVDLFPFKAYRHYRVLSRRRQAAVLHAELERARSTDGSVLLISDEGIAACVRPLPWDTGFFGLPMGRLEALLREPGTSPAALSRFVASALEAARAQGLAHVAARADVEDLDAVAALESNGFVLMDALVTYFTHPRRRPPIAVREFGRVRPFEPSDADQVLQITRDAYQGFRGRYQLDAHLPRERADAFYLEWARGCLSGQMADRIVVADDGHGGIHGWASTRRVEPVSSVSGTTVYAGSLGACRRDRPGAYAGLIRALAMENYQAGAVTETQTQNHNVATVQIYEAVGAQYVRADYTFHAWLGRREN